MAEAAERPLEGTGWLPAPLRTPGLERSNPRAFETPAGSRQDEPESEDASEAVVGESACLMGWEHTDDIPYGIAAE